MAKKETNISQDFEAQIPEKEKKPSLFIRMKEKIKEIFTKENFNKRKKLILIGTGVFVFLILALFIISSNYQVSQFKPPTIPSPSPTEEEITNPSAYAIDSAVLEIEKRLKEIEKEIDQTDLKETELNPPVLDMDVNFEE